MEKIISELMIKYPVVHTHSLRVYFLVYFILEKLPKYKHEKELLMAAFLHDIGKSLWLKEWHEVPREELKPEAWDQMKHHPSVSVEIVKDIAGFPDNLVLRIIEEHHEQPNGLGYPNRKTDLLPESILLACCDIYAACTEVRNYRQKSLSHEQAIIEVSKIDEKIAQAMDKAITKGGF